MTISPAWRALQHCFSSQSCAHTDKLTAPVFTSITIQMYKARLKKIRSALTVYSKHRKTEQLWLHRTPMFSCCTSDPTQLHAPYTLCTRHKMPLYWSGWPGKAYTLLLQWESSVSANTFLPLCILEHHHHCSHPLWSNSGFWPNQTNEVFSSLRANGFSVLFLYHRKHWHSSYTPTGYFHTQSSKIIWTLAAEWFFELLLISGINYHWSLTSSA